MEQIFFVELTGIFLVVTILAIICHIIKLPTILAYIFAGLVIGPLGLFGTELFQDATAFEALSKIGITLLLFILGLEMKVSELRSVGKVAAATGIGQILFTSGIGYVLAVLLGFESREALYIAIALTFSSTIVIVKLLSDKKDLNSLYGKISVGFLLIQDFVAILALLLLNSLASAETLSVMSIILIVGKAILLFGFVIFLSNNVLPKIIGALSHSLELLFAFAVAWAFGVSFIVSSDLVGLSIEIGGFVAGLALANSIESLQIASKIRTLRDFFIIVFFVHLGMTLEFGNIVESLPTAVLFSIFVLVGNPIIVLIILRMMKYKPRVGFLSGLTVAQISEFSLIVIFLGNEIGHVSDQGVSVVTLVGIITFALSSYMIMNGDRLYDLLHPFLSKLERPDHIDDDGSLDISDHVVVVGIDQMGGAILDAFKDSKDEIVAVDFNPDRIKKITENGYSVIFGDIIEEDVMVRAGVDKARTIILTIPNLEDNVIVIKTVKEMNPDAEIIVSAQEEYYKSMLEEAGASTIIEPFTLAGQMLGTLVQQPKVDESN